MIKVKNICYYKCVLVRYILDSWIFFIDLDVVYVFELNDGVIDRFLFVIMFFEYFFVFGGVLEFVVCFEGEGIEFWDNNSG